MPKRKRSQAAESDDSAPRRHNTRSRTKPPTTTAPSPPIKPTKKTTTAHPKRRNPAPPAPKQRKTAPATPNLPSTDPTNPSPQTFTLPSETKPIPCNRHGPPTSTPSLIFTHGASGTLSTPSTANFLAGFSTLSPVVGFQGSMNLTSRTRNFKSVLAHEQRGSEAIALGGRSMGARAAVLTAGGWETGALVLVSFPLVGPKGEVREEGLLALGEGVEVLFVSGTRDGMCDLARLREVIGKMKAKSWVLEVEGADHGMGMAQKAAVEKVVRRTGRMAAEWLGERDGEKRVCSLRWDREAGEVVESGWRESG